MSNQIQTVSFYGASLITFQQDGIIYTAIRPIVEALGLNWASQSVKLSKNKERFGCCDIATPTKGGVQNMVFIPIRKLNGWLFSINPEKVRADLKAKVIQYQEECFEVLFNYWNNGIAVNHRLSSDDTLPLRNAVSMATGILKLDYATIYKMVHQRFGISEIKDLTKEQVGQAVEYVHSLMVKAREYNTPQLLKECVRHLQDYAKLLKSLKYFPLLDEQIARHRHDGVAITHNQLIKLL